MFMGVTCFIVAGVIYFFQSRQFRTDGVREWSAGYIFQGVYWVFLGLRGLIPDFLSIIVANTFLTAGYSLLYAAVREFQHRSYRRNILFLPAIVTLIFVSFFSAYVDNFFLRTVYISLLSTIQMGSIALILFREGPFQLNRSQWVTGCFFATGATLWFIRLLERLIYQTQFWGPSIVLSALLILGFGVIVLTSIGFMLMIRERAGEALQKSEERFRQLADATFEGILIHDKGVILDVNQALTRLTGYDYEEAIGKDVFAFIAPESKEVVLHRMQHSSVAPFEISLIKKDRTTCLVEGIAKDITYGGKMVRVVAMRDITERKKAEEELRQSEEQFRLLSSTAERLLSADDPQTIVEDLCRDVMAHLDCQAFFNFLVDEKAGRLCLNAFAGVSEEDGRAIEWLDYSVAVCGCVAQARHRIIAEDIFHTPDVRTELVKSYGIQAYCCHPLLAQDRLIGTLSFGTKTRPHFTPEEVELMRMVTDQVAVAMQRKQVEQNLQEAKDYLEHRVEERTQDLKVASLYTRRLIETNLDPLVTISTSGKITDVNIATELVTGLSRSELLGSDFSDYFTEPEKARAGYEKVFQEGSVRDYPLAIRHRSGRVTEVLYNASTYMNEDGEIQGVFAAARDVTELRQAQSDLRKSHEELERRVEERTVELKERTEALEAANKELESFSYSVSHDLRAPLRAIDGYARMILKKQGDKFDEDTLRKFNDIRLNAQTMGKLIDDLLTFSRLSRKDMSASDLNMVDIIRDVWKELNNINPYRTMHLIIKSTPRGYGDAALVKQVYHNLLSNAVKFTKLQDDAHIEVGGYNDGNEDVFYVKDNGVGFDMKYYDKLFGVFQRLHNNPHFEGTGVGLATVQRIVHRQGGRVWAEGKVNEGATFYFTLPHIGNILTS
jgi:PAS domain S-box-containing protein